MKQLTLTILTTLALLAFSGVIQAQSGSVSPGNVSQGGQVTVTITGCVPGATYDVIFSGVSDSGTSVNATQKKVANGAGVLSWHETIGWPVALYQTNASIRIGSGQPTNVATDSLNVTP